MQQSHFDLKDAGDSTKLLSATDASGRGWILKTTTTDSKNYNFLMQTSLQDIAMNIQKYKIANFKVTGASVTDIGIASSYPTQGTALYTVSLTPMTSGKLSSEQWVLTATPITNSPQQGNGHIVLNYRGERCWTKATDINSGTACTPSASTNWDGR